MTLMVQCRMHDGTAACSAVEDGSLGLLREAAKATGVVGFEILLGERGCAARRQTLRQETERVPFRFGRTPADKLCELEFVR